MAFALIRKPIREQLFLLEWILTNRDEFINEFAKGPKHVDITNLLRTKKPWVRRTIEDAASRSYYSELVDPELIWELRFEKSAAWSLEGLWNRAIHLVTTCKHYETEHENLNFAHIDEEDREYYLFEYYKKVPYVMLHLSGVVKAIAKRWNKDFVSYGNTFTFDLRVISNLEMSFIEVTEPPVHSFGTECMNEFFNEAELACPSCGKQHHFDHPSELSSFVTEMTIVCTECGHADDSMAAEDETEIEEGESDDDSSLEDGV